jgi:hypothetical protein
VRSIGVTEQTYYRWRKEYGGLQVGQAKRMKEIEKENARLRRASPTSHSTTRSCRKSCGESSKPFTHAAKRSIMWWKTLGVSERRACRVIGQHRSTQRKPRVPRQR